MRRYRELYSCILAVTWLLLAGSSWGLEPVQLSGDLRPVSLVSHTGWVHDTSGEWGPQQALQQEFTRVPDQPLGRHDGAIWLRVDLDNTSGQFLRWALDTGDRHTEYVDFYLLDRRTGEVLEHSSSGIARNIRERELDTLGIVFGLRVPADAEVTVLLRLESSFNLRHSLHMYSPVQFLGMEMQELIPALVLYGIIIGLIIYNGIFAAYVREVQYLIFVALLLSWTLFVASTDGYIYLVWPYELLGPYPPWFYYFVLGCAMATLSVFTLNYLQLKRLGPVWVRLQQMFILIGVFVAIGPHIVGYDLIFELTLVMLFVATVVNIASGWMTYRQGRAYAVEYMLAFGLMLLTIVYLVVADNTTAYTVFRLVLFFPALFFSIGIGNRINQMKSEALALQRDAELANYTAEFKSRFLATMSHEIRTPMNGVLGMVDILKRTQLDNTQRQYLDVVDSSGRALLSVINDILDYSKLESGHVTLENISIRLEDFLDECIGVFATVQRGRDIEFSTYISPDLPHHFMGDPTRLKQILVNLLGNAFKFTSDGQVQLRVVEENEGEACYIRFEVVDTGAGIQREALDHLFQPFGQADGSITRNYGGTGLGLAISKQLVDVMHGDIYVESEFGKGSNFSFRVPLVLGDSAEEQAYLADTARLRGRRVLIVDDHEAFCLSTAGTLRSWGVEVSLADSCTGALDVLRSEKVDLVLLDVLLPDGNGIERALELRQAQDNPALQIISISSNADVPDPAQLQRQEVALHLIKPLQFGPLRKILLERLAPPDKSPVYEGVAEGLGGLKVLVAEDNPTNQMVIKGLLQLLNVDYTVVENGALAVEAFKRGIRDSSRPFGAVLMDCEMPVLDGYSATREIRRYEQDRDVSRQTPIIGLSAHAMQEFHDKAYSAGMNHYLTKPVKLAVLREVLSGCTEPAA